MIFVGSIIVANSSRLRTWIGRSAFALTFLVRYQLAKSAGDNTRCYLCGTYRCTAALWCTRKQARRRSRQGAKRLSRTKTHGAAKNEHHPATVEQALFLRRTEWSLPIHVSINRSIGCACLKAMRIDVHRRTCAEISVSIDTTLQPNRITLHIPPDRRVVIAEVVVFRPHAYLMRPAIAAL
jgi:hypothetical protein